MTKAKCAPICSALYSSPFSLPSPTSTVCSLAHSGLRGVAPSFLVKLTYLPSRPWYCCYRSIHPHQLQRPCSCLIPFQGILTPPLVSQGGRPELNIGSVVSLSSSPQCQPPVCLPQETPNHTSISSLSEPPLPPQHRV